MRNNQSNRIISKLALIGVIAVTLLVLISVPTIDKKVVSGRQMAADDSGYTSYEIGWPINFATYNTFMSIGTPMAKLADINWQNLLIDFGLYSAVSALSIGIYHKHRKNNE